MPASRGDNAQKHWARLYQPQHALRGVVARTRNPYRSEEVMPQEYPISMQDRSSQPDVDRWEPISMLAQRFGISVRSLYAWCHAGLRHSRPGGRRRIYVRESDLRTYLDSHATAVDKR